MSRVNRLLLALCLGGAACGVSAQEAYVVGGFGTSNWSFSSCGATGCDRNASSWRVGAGYRFNRVVAVEGSYFNYGCARSSSVSLDGELCGTSLGVQALLGYQVAAFDFGGKIGFAGVRSDFRPSATSFDTAATSNNTELTVGLMGAYRITPNLALRLDADIVTVALNSSGLFYSRGADVTTIMLGLMLRF